MDKLENLKSILRSYRSVLIAFSGGVDSTFLLKVAKDTLGPQNVKAATAESVTFPCEELEISKQLTRVLDVSHVVFSTNEISSPEFFQNNPDRCYFCKRELFSELKKIAHKEELKTVCDGSTSDDDFDYRPGRRALEELGIKSPLKEALLTKEDIRAFSKELGLPTWDKSSFACLASRFPYGEEITPDKLRLVAAAERVLRGLEFKQFRVRYHKDTARIEVAKEEMDRFSKSEVRDEISKSLKSLGFRYVTLDLEGYRTGSLNEVLEQKGTPRSRLPTGR